MHKLQEIWFAFSSSQILDCHFKKSQVMCYLAVYSHVPAFCFCSHGTLNLAPPNSRGAITVSNQSGDKIRSALKMSPSYGRAELIQQQVCREHDHNGWRKCSRMGVTQNVQISFCLKQTQTVVSYASYQLIKGFSLRYSHVKEECCSGRGRGSELVASK